MMTTKAAREFSDTTRQKLADKGVAMPDGSYPIPDKDALRRAIASFGRAKDPDAVKRHIIKRAKALGAVDMLPEDWGGAPAGKGSIAAGHASQAADVLEDLYCLIACEADETQQANLLRQAADLVTQFMTLEAKEIGQPGDSDEPDVYAVGKARGIRSLHELKAEPLTEKQLDRWLSGEISRRILVIPFGGPLPSEKSSLGVDLDGEWFDDKTDIYGPYPYLRKSRERLVDWHHDHMDGVPAYASMKGALLGKIVLDDGPSTLETEDGDFEGIAADFWANAGERRLALIKALARRNHPIFGSSQAMKGRWHVEPDGHIDLWPVVRHTISTSPQNTWAVVPPLKALLEAPDVSFDEVGTEALRAAAFGLESHGRTSARPLDPRADSKRAAKALRLLEAARWMRLIESYRQTGDTNSV